VPDVADTEKASERRQSRTGSTARSRAVQPTKEPAWRRFGL